MAKTKYDVGDILTFCVEDRCYATAVIAKWHIKNKYIEGITLEQHTDYDLFIKSEEKDNFELVQDVPECAFYNYKIVGHIDISGMPNDEVKTHLDHAVAWEWCERRVAYAVQAHWALMKLREPKEENDYVKKEFYIPKVDDSSFCCNSCNKFEKENDRLKRENERLKEEFGSASNNILGLKREIDSLRNSYNDTEARISRNLHNLGFTNNAVYKIMYSD